MDSEQYSDEWTDAVNYEVTITGNNGFALLERIAYDGPSELTSLYDLVHAAIVATGLPYTTITVATGTTIGGEEELETCLDKIYSKPDNFVDEKGVVMSWREVLESILTPLDLGIFAHGDAVYLRDTHTMGLEEFAKAGLWREPLARRVKYPAHNPRLGTGRVYNILRKSP